MIHLERLTWDNYDDVLKLKVAKEQKEYIVPNSDSLIHAFFAMTENKAQIFPFGIYLGKTPVGFKMRAAGASERAARYGGISVNKYLVLAMLVSGACCGLAGTVEILGVHHRGLGNCTGGYGFSGIVVALFGGLHPIGAVFSSFFIQHITAGGAYVDKTLYCAQVSDFICALIIYLCGFVLFMKTAMNRSLDKRDEKRKAKNEGGKK